MSLTEVPLKIHQAEIPDDIREFLRVADARVKPYISNSYDSYRGFVPSDFGTLYHALRLIVEQNLACGDAFCEWGSGLGVVAALASVLGFEACGIELDQKLYQASQELIDEFGIYVDFVNGSFIPPDAEHLIDRAFAATEGELSLVTQADNAYSDLGLDIADFDLVFNYPWPNDAELTANLFEHYAARGALLMTYSELDGVRLRRK